MNSREFDFYKNGEFDFDNMNAGMIIIEGMLQDIDIILRDYNLEEEKKEYLINRRQIISSFFEKYKQIFSKGRLLNEWNALKYTSNLNPNDKQQYQRLSEIIMMVNRRNLRKYDVDLPYYEHRNDNNGEEILKFYQYFYQELSSCFDIEDEIHEYIVIPIWRNCLDSLDSNFEQGNRFAYLLHSSNRFIKLPGCEGYQSRKLNIEDFEHKEAFISTSLITDKEMETGCSNVGILIKMKEKTILSSFPSDCGTIETDKKNATNIKNMRNGISVTIAYGSLTHNIPFSKLGTPKHIEKGAIEASINNSGEILNAGKWITPIYTEVVVDKEDFELEGIFFKTTGCDINLHDYILAKQMEMYYGKNLIKINQSIYRKQNGLEPYTKEEKERFAQQLQFYNNVENYKMFEENPILYRNLIQLYYKEIVCDTKFEADVKAKIECTFVKIIEHLNKIIQERQLQDSNQIKLNEIMELDLDSKTFPQTTYVPEFVWGSCAVTKENIEKEFVMDMPVDLKNKVTRLLELPDIELEQRGEI